VPSLFIDGVWTAPASGATSTVVNPFDGSEAAVVDVADDADVQRAIAAARRAFDAGDWSSLPPGERGTILGRVADLLARDREEVARTETLNTGKGCARALHVARHSRLLYYAGLADKEAGRVVATGLPNAISRIVYNPSVCG
jgi:betaine-aldehyde dehydrogenase